MLLYSLSSTKCPIYKLEWRKINTFFKNFKQKTRIKKFVTILQYILLWALKLWYTNIDLRS